MFRPGLAHLPNGALQIRVGDLDHAARQAEVRHQLHQVLQPAGALVGKFHQQDGVGIALEEGVHRLHERRDLARQADHGAIDQLDRRGAELDDVLRELHRGVELREVAHAERALLGQACKLQMQRAPNKRACPRIRPADARRWRAAGRGGRGCTRRPCAALWGSALRFPAFSRSYKPFNRAMNSPYEPERLLVHRPEAPALAAGRQRIDGEHVVHHVPVGDRARAARVVARHAADRRLRAGRDIDGKPQAVLAQLRIQRIEHHAGLHDRLGWRKVDLQHAVEILGVVDDERFAHRLAALRAAGAARQDRDAFLHRDGDRRARRLFAAGHNDADRLQLVDRGVGGIASAAGRVEHDLGVELLAQARGETGVAGPRKPDRDQGGVHRGNG